MELITEFDWKLLSKYITIGETYAIDFETNGLDATAPDFKLFGVGVADDTRAFYIDFRNFSVRDFEDTLIRLSQCKLIAHNVIFDGACMYRFTKSWPEFIGCSLVLFKMMAAEGWLGQRWGLDVAIEDVLGWPESNKDTLAELLARHKLPKSRMYQLADLEPEAFGEYCGMDADACWQLWHALVDQCKGGLENILQWHQGPYIAQLEVLVEQQFRGIKIDEHGMLMYLTKVNLKADRKIKEFLTHSKVNPHISAYNKAIIDAHEAKEPAQKTKTGKPSVRWMNWYEKLKELQQTNQFNVNSKQQLADLFYDKIYDSYLGAPNWKGEQKWNIKVDDTVIEVETTASGGRPIDKKLLPRLGRPGQLLAEYNKLLKEAQYVQSCLDKLRDGVLHPQFKPHGTVTGRLGGDGGFNLQQQPKTRGYLSCFKARRGHTILQLDFSAIEPVVLTNASRDTTLMKLYGPEAKPNDVYLYVAAHIRSFAGEVRKYYDPDHPTPATISEAKKHCKKIRSTCKTVHLAKQYGAGAGRIKYTLADQGIDLDWDQAKDVCGDWDELFSGTKEFEEKLNREWESQGGYIYNLVHRPIAVDESKKKDLVNRYCQSSGHDILLVYLAYIQELRKERGVEMYPWILDFHDETMWEVPDENVEAAEQILLDSLDKLNDFLGLTVQVKGDTLIVDTLAEVKCED